jgi:hypothetical protein
MAILKTNADGSSYDLGAATSATLSYNHPSGSNWLIVVVAVDSYSNTLTATYNGQSMTIILNEATYYGGKWLVFKYDASAESGTHDVVVSNFQAYDRVAVSAFSFSGADDVGLTAFSNTPSGGVAKTDTIAISEGSMIIVNGWNGTGSPGTTTIEAPQYTSVSVDNELIMYTTTWNGVSAALSSGTKTVEVDESPGHNSIILSIEVLAAAEEGGRRRIIII